MMQAIAATTPVSLLSDLGDLWQSLDAIFVSLEPSDWFRQHGPHWTFADVPYHLAYFDREIVARPLEQGPDLPTAEQWAARASPELNAWNARRFAERPATQTVEQSLEQMRASRTAIQGVVDAMYDTDLDRPTWFPLLVGGWLPARAVLAGCRFHTWSHFMELRLRRPEGTRRSTPELRKATIHGALGDAMSFFPLALNRAQVATAQFSLVMEFTGPGGGAWTIRVADGACTVAEGWPARSDLVITQSAETFMKTRIGMLDPMMAIQSGEIKIQNIEHMGTFALLFPPPQPDDAAVLAPDSVVH
jgi:hypothetical protein